MLMEPRGEFETHITVRMGDATAIGPLRQWGEQHGWGCVHILLARGDCASQPMLTQRARGTLASVRAAAETCARALEAAGFAVTRIKIEVAADAAIPSPEEPDRYFEHHVKLLLSPDAELQALAAIAERHGAHLSRNALRSRPDSFQERFVTQRCYSRGRREARSRLETLLAELTPLGHPVLDVEEEYTVYDSNIAVDAGWIRTEG
jgi:hypothetical protein